MSEIGSGVSTGYRNSRLWHLIVETNNK